MELINDPDYDYLGFQVVRGEFFPHTYEPCLTFADCKVYVNTACIRKMPMYDYVQMLVDPDKKRVAVLPCEEGEKDSFRWCSATDKRSPKQISCKIFFAKVFALMGWDPKNRYKLIGKWRDTKIGKIFAYDLTCPEVYERKVKEDGKIITSRVPIYSEDWKNQFGVPITEHMAGNIVNIFNNSAVFTLTKDPKGLSMEEAFASVEKESGVKKNDGSDAEDVVE
ncbi:MAG: integrase [Lachnospiraceae bacterium]|nr:integrase [Lachnospiraceae bacterium]